MNSENSQNVKDLFVRRNDNNLVLCVRANFVWGTKKKQQNVDYLLGFELKSTQVGNFSVSLLRNYNNFQVPRYFTTV